MARSMNDVDGDKDNACGEAAEMGEIEKRRIGEGRRRAGNRPVSLQREKNTYH